MIARGAIVREARRWLGTPFLHGQSCLGAGCDCIGLVVGVAAAFDLPEAFRWQRDTRFRGYGRLPQPEKLLAACAEYLDAIVPSDARIGDILLMTFFKEPMHFGFISSEAPRYLLHGYEPAGKVVENIVDLKWSRRVIGAFKLRGID